MSVPSNTTRPQHPGNARRRLVALGVLGAFMLLPVSARAQLTLTHTEDASPIPAGTVRFRVISSWTRWDARFINGGTRSLDDEISTDSLGARQLPQLLAVETGLQTLTNNPLTRLTLGRLSAQSDVRIVNAPIALELGLTRRLSVGIMVPFIQARRNMHISVNADSARLANVGFIQERNRATAANTNTVVYTALQGAADSLSTLISKCPATPAAVGCAAVTANPAGAASARDQAMAFAQAIKSSLGTDSAGAIVAPRAGSALATAIDARRAALNQQLQTYLGPTAGTSAGVFTSSSDFSYIDLQGRSGVPGLLRSSAGGGLDSLRTSERVIAGGITFAARWLVFDHFQHDSTPLGWQSRFAVGGEFRLQSFAADSARVLGAVSPIQGSGVAVNGAMDLVRGRIGATLAARYDKYFARTVETSVAGDPEAFYPIPAFTRVQRTPGDLVTIDVTPRFLVGQWFALDGHYGLERSGAPTYAFGDAPCANCTGVFASAFTPPVARTAQRIGFGVRYSTVDAYMRGAANTPVEVSLSHLETITGDAGLPKIFRDQIQVRLYWSLFGKH